MIITFKTSVYPDVVMFGDIAAQLLKAMGENTEPPGILRGENIKTASDKLRVYLQMLPPDVPQPINESGEPTDEEIREQLNHVGLRKRALPLLELMDAAYRKDTDVIWR